MTGAISISSGIYGSCALIGDGTARCWGENNSGQLGNGTQALSTTPVVVSGLAGATAISVGDRHSCALINDGTARCWGENSWGQLGTGAATAFSSVPVVVSGLAGATAIAAGQSHTCALVDDGTVRCWGRNFAGALGNGTTADSATPVTVTGLTGATAISAGYFQSCALTTDGTARCWGLNDQGQLGNGATANAATPVAVVGLAGATAIAIGALHACALIDDGTARCWGENAAGPLGNGTTASSLTPVTVAGLTGASAITAGYNVSCALKTDGTARCWGVNNAGQLGNGATTNSSIPVPVVGLNVIVCAAVNTTGIAGWWRGDGDTSAQIGPAVSGAARYTIGRSFQGFDLAPNTSLSATGVTQPTNALTLELWVRPQANSGSVQTLLSRWSGVGFTDANDVSHAYNLELHPNNDLVFETDDLTTRVPEQLRVSAPQLVDGNFHHIAATWTPTAMTLYIDGAQVATKPSQGGRLQTGGTTPVRIGGPFGLTGVIDEPTIWTRALTPTEINAIATTDGGKCQTTTGTISTVAGNGIQGFSGDGGQATDAALSFPYAVAIDGTGNLYIPDFGNNRVRKVSPSGVISTVAGNGTQGFSGDGGPATAASLAGPTGVAIDGAGNLFVSDDLNHRIRKISAAGVISTVAGNGTQGFSGDGGPATAATLSGTPKGLAVDGAGNLYIADQINNRVRKVSPAGVISTVAGNGTQGFSGDGGPAVNAALNYPTWVAVDNVGNLYIADLNNNRVRKVSASGVISTVAGNGTQGSSGDDGPAVDAALANPAGLAVDGTGNLYIAEFLGARVRKVSPSGVISTVAGNGTFGFSGDGGPATSAALTNPGGLAVDGSGNLYIADVDNDRVRMVAA